MGQRFKFPAPTVALAPAAPLTLPSIAAVPLNLVHQKSTASASPIALSFLDLGLATEEDAGYAATPALFVDRIFKRWVAARTKGMKNLSPYIDLTDSLEAFKEKDQSDSPVTHIGISFTEDDALFFSLKEKIEHLERLVPGLGETALQALYVWLCRTTLSISPDFVHSLVQHHYWMGWDDESEYLADMAAMGDDEDAECPVTLADFEEDFPKHVYSPSKVIKKTQLRKLKTHPDPLVASVAKHLLSEPNKKAWERPDYLSDLRSENEGAGYATVLHWKDSGSQITNQVCDDWLRYAHESGSTSLFAVYSMSGQDTESLRNLLGSLENYINVLRWVDEAISLVASPQD